MVKGTGLYWQMVFLVFMHAKSYVEIDSCVFRGVKHEACS